MTLGTLLPILGLYSLTLFTPGPAKLLVIAISVSMGRARGLAAAYGITLASVIWSSTAAFGFAAAIEAYPAFVGYLRGLGAGYLIWLSFMCFRAAVGVVSDRTIREYMPETNGKAFILGLLVHLTNPNAAFFWIGLFAFAASPDLTVAGLGTIIALCAVMALAGFSTYAIVFASRRVAAGAGRARRGAAIVLGIVFGGAALRIVWQLLA